MEQPLATDAVAYNEKAAEPVVSNSTLAGIDLGIVVVGHLDAVDLESVVRAHSDWEAILKRRFPQYEWRVPLVRRPENILPARVEPVPLLQHAIEERDVHGWDFCLLVTGSDLIPHYGARSLAAVSRMLDAAVISTARIDPFAFDETVERSHRIDVLSERIETLFRHCFGHLCGLGHSEDPTNPMYDPQSVDDLTPMGLLRDDQIARMADFLTTVEDARLEEFETPVTGFRFFLKSIWLNRYRILDSVWNARPWTFVRHLGRLNTAASSTAIILLITAETWDLALSQDQWMLSCLMIVALCWSTYSVLRRQRLLIKREHRLQSEQMVVRNVATVLTILLAMATTAVLIFVGVLAVGGIAFHTHLVESWAASKETPITVADYTLMATFVASLSMLVGALGASFEDQYAVRHLTFVDEET